MKNDYGKPKGAVSIVHRCPPLDEALMPCCGKTPFEIPRWHGMTIRGKVTCKGNKPKQCSNEILTMLNGKVVALPCKRLGRHVKHEAIAIYRWDSKERHPKGKWFIRT